MDISPISFGKVVKVRDRKSTAENISSLANSRITNATHRLIQKDAKAIFDDATPSGPVRVITVNSGRDVYLVSGDESQIISQALSNYRSDLASSKLFMKDKAVRKSFCDDSREIAQKTISCILQNNLEPFAIKVGEVKGEHRIQKIDINV